MATSGYMLTENAARRTAAAVRRVEDTPRFGPADRTRRRLTIRPSVLFAVKVLKTSGSAGSSSTTVSFVYTVKTLEGVTIGTSLSPKVKRHSNVAYVDPSTTEYEGLAYVDATGAIALYDANEIVDLEAC